MPLLLWITGYLQSQYCVIRFQFQMRRLWDNVPVVDDVLDEEGIRCTTSPLKHAGGRMGMCGFYFIVPLTKDILCVLRAEVVAVTLGI